MIYTLGELFLQVIGGVMPTIKGVPLDKLISLVTGDPWLSSLKHVKKLPLRGVSVVLNDDNNLNITKTRDDPENSIDLAALLDLNLSSLTWDAVLRDMNVFHFYLFSVTSNINPLLEVLKAENREAALDLLSKVMGGACMAHIVYILCDWQHGAEDPVFQQVSSSLPIAVREAFTDVVNGKFALKETVSFIDLATSDEFHAAYVAFFEGHAASDEFGGFLMMDVDKGNLYELQLNSVSS
jgi:hypothetical protein